MRRTKIPKKGLLTVLLGTLFILMPAGYVLAKVTGVCSNCHTMHNSQNGTAMATFGGETGPNRALTRGSCLGCHGQSPSGSNNIITNIPQVSHNGTPDLAGGNFAYITGTKTPVTGNASSVGHNVTDLGASYYEGTLTAPPGDQHSTGITQSNFTCAGQYGCHGDRSISGNFEAITGSHHVNDGVLKFGSINLGSQGSTTGLSYRFLKEVKGGEETNWMGVSPSPTVHNEYFGATTMGTSSRTAPANNTISGLCAECHGYFHGPEAGETGGTASPWKRHPTDISLPATGEYSAYTAYSTEAPVARTSIPASPSSEVTPSGTSDDIVMCLSCHRAHASAYEDILRWDYGNMNAGGGSNTGGCFTCHTTKDTGS